MWEVTRATAPAPTPSSGPLLPSLLRDRVEGEDGVTRLQYRLLRRHSTVVIRLIMPHHPGSPRCRRPCCESEWSGRRGRRGGGSARRSRWRGGEGGGGKQACVCVCGGGGWGR